tara:strand:- start:1081 stop:1878 length:798 start_codon:yes stop_codon:yes gene_type:complete
MKLTVISLGAGVQSSTMALMANEGLIDPMPDCAIFADTQNEPQYIYDYLEYLKGILKYPVYTVSKGNIKEDMLVPTPGGYTFPTAPFYTLKKGKKGMIMRQCTNSYKIQPIRKKIRELLGLKRYQHVKKDMFVEQWIGISTDEIMRMKDARDKFITNRWPLLEMKLSRQACIDWMKDRGYKMPEKSACNMCPFHDDRYWANLKENHPKEFADAVDSDNKVRHLGRDKEASLFIHKSCKPLSEVEFKVDKKEPDLFDNVCEGMCGV